MKTILNRIECVANCLLDFDGEKSCVLDISNDELTQLKYDIDEEYDDLKVEKVNNDTGSYSLRLCGIGFILQIK